MSHLLQRHELRRPRRTDAWAAVLHDLAGHREFPDVVSDHLGLDLHGLERLPVVDRDLLPHEVREDRYVAAVGPEPLLLPGLGAESLHEDRLLLVEPSPERPPGPRGEELDDLLEGHRLHLVEGVAAVRELLLPADLDARRALP